MGNNLKKLQEKKMALQSRVNAIRKIRSERVRIKAQEDKLKREIGMLRSEARKDIINLGKKVKTTALKHRAKTRAFLRKPSTKKKIKSFKRWLDRFGTLD